MSCSQPDWSHAFRSLQLRPRRDPVVRREPPDRPLSGVLEDHPDVEWRARRASLIETEWRTGMTRFNTRALTSLAVSGALLAALVGLSGCKSEATTAQQAPAPQVSV